MWAKGTLQVALNANPNPALLPGTPIATFDPDGTYPGATGTLSNGGTAHTAIFLGYGYRDGALGMYMLDQYTASADPQPAEIRFNPAIAQEYFNIIIRN
jgi:hypothetical protein